MQAQDLQVTAAGDEVPDEIRLIVRNISKVKFEGCQIGEERGEGRRWLNRLFKLSLQFQRF